MSEAALTALPLPTRLDVLWRIARPHTRPLTLALVPGLAAFATDLVSPLATKWILDALDAGASLAVPVLILAGLLVVGALVSWWQWLLLGTLDRRGRRLRQGPGRDGTGPAAAGARAATGDGPLRGQSGRMACVSDARLVARGTHTQLLERSDTYRKLVQALKIEGSGRTALPTSVPEPSIGPTPRRHTGRD